MQTKGVPHTPHERLVLPRGEDENSYRPTPGKKWEGEKPAKERVVLSVKKLRKK